MKVEISTILLLKMKKNYLILFSILLQMSTPLVADTLHSLSYTKNWSIEAATARQHSIPIMVVFSTNDCLYCEKLKRDVLLPIVAQRRLAGKVHLREFNIDSGGKVTDFSGDRIRSRIFVNRYEVFATPTVVLLDYEGVPLASPIVGYNNVAEYTRNLEQVIDSVHL